MIIRFIATAGLAASLVFGQSSAELMQRGIYLQETAGDVDAAIQVFRQIVASAPGQPAIAAQAQSRITQSLLQKGDVLGAGREFEILARNYSGERATVDAMGRRLRTIAENGPVQLLGSFQNGKYHHYWTGVELTAPAGWTFKGQKTSAGEWDRVDLVDPAARATSAQVVMTREPGPELDSSFAVVPVVNGVPQYPPHHENPAPLNIPEFLQSRLKAKLNQRGDAAGYHGYAYRQDSIQTRMIRGQQAISVVGDYKDDKGMPQSEYLTFIQSEKTRMCFSVTALASDFPDVMARFESIVSTAVVP